MSQGWKRLSLPSEGPQPPIYIKFSTSASGYKIYLTDLSHIWTESLNRREIIKRALTDDTSIDPSEDAEQFQVLLRKLRDALYGSKGSKVVVDRASRGNDLKITTTTKLPAPLQPLEWNINLSKCAQNVFTRHVVLPLLKEERVRENQLSSLIDRLKEKDWVLGKLFDKIEAVGLDLGSVFPSAAGVRSTHKGMTFDQAAKSIKGVAAFDEDTWKAAVEDRDENKNSDRLSFPATDIDIESLETTSDHWWDNLDSGISTAKQGASSSSTKPRQVRDQETSEGSDDDEEFQRQETPPWLKQTTRDRSPSALPADADRTTVQGDAGHSETASDDEPPARASTASTQTSHKAKAGSKNLGMIGGKKKAKKDRRSRKSTASTASASESPPPATTKPNAEDSTESDEEDVPKPTRQPPDEKTVKPSAEDKPKKPRAGGLGVIGGGKKYKDKQVSRDPTPLPDRSRDASGDEEESRPQESPKKPKRGGKLGVIGKKANRDSKDLPSRTSKTSTPIYNDDDESDDLDAPASKPSSKPAEPPKDETSSSPEPPPRKKPTSEPKREETATERANRRREELKRQLEAKEKAPTKKKRKF